jgi:hypothetical protein
MAPAWHRVSRPGSASDAHVPRRARVAREVDSLDRIVATLYKRAYRPR